MILKPPIHDLPAGTILNAGLGISTILPDFDFETYSPAGYTWDEVKERWKSPRGAGKSIRGLPLISTVCYTEHPDTEILSLAYNLKNGTGAKLWRPGEPAPIDLFNHILKGGLLEAWNCAFEYWTWKNIGHVRFGWPDLPLHQLRCAMAKARAFALPGKLDNTAKVLRLTQQKDARGERLLNKFSKPRNPTKKDKRTRIVPVACDADSIALWQYNLQDIKAEAEASSRIPDLMPGELLFWMVDQAINVRGVQVDVTSIKNCIKIIEQVYEKYNRELSELTFEQVKSVFEVKKLKKWLISRDVNIDSLSFESVQKALQTPDLPEREKRVLQIREQISSAAVKKVYSMIHQVSKQRRLHNLFIYHSARTGRAAGAGPQPQNLPNSGPEVLQCETCNKYFSFDLTKSVCPYCNGLVSNIREWNADCTEQALAAINTGNLTCVEWYWGNAIDIVSACLRGLFIAAPGCKLVCSDYKAIEAVVLAALAGEQWRLDVFNTHGRIYEMSASKITGVSFEEFERHKKETGLHHPLRKSVGKVAELASGYQGWVGAWKQFGAEEFFTDAEIERAVLAWRAENPAIVNMWKEIEKIAHCAVMSPGNFFKYRGIGYIVHNDILYCKLKSGRYLTYHKPKLTSGISYGRVKNFLSFEGWNTNPKNGATGWQRISTFGGRLVENIVQATARDILAYAIINLEKAGYKVVLHVHDEIVAEIPKNSNHSLEEFESIMNQMPEWAKDWPIKASGGWIDERYRK